MFDPDIGHPFAPVVPDDPEMSRGGALLEEDLPEVSATVLDPTSRIAMEMQEQHDQHILQQQEQELLPTLSRMLSGSKWNSH